MRNGNDDRMSDTGKRDGNMGPELELDGIEVMAGDCLATVHRINLDVACCIVRMYSSTVSRQKTPTSPTRPAKRPVRRAEKPTPSSVA